MITIIKGVEGDKVIEMALKTPEKFVLKPQREGGGMCMLTTLASKLLKLGFLFFAIYRS